MKKIFTLILILIHTILFSQEKGIIRGSVYDSETGEPLFAANVGVKGTSIGATTDFDGNFEITSEKISNYLNKFNIASNDITLIISYIGYNTVEIENIKIKDDDIYLLENIKMAPNSVSKSFKVFLPHVPVKRNDIFPFKLGLFAGIKVF